MAKVKVTNSTEKFKKVIHDLPADPGQGIEFLAFRADKDGEKDTVMGGLYPGPTMKNDFTKDKGAQKSPQLIKGILHRSAKMPDKKLVLESPAQPALVKELGKACLKEAKLKLVVVAMRPGDAEPDLTADELAELGLPSPSDTPAPPARPAAPTPGARAQPTPPPRPAAAPGAIPQPAVPARPGTPAPAPGPAPASPARPAAAAPTGADFDTFKNRLKVMMPRIQDAGTFHPALAKKAVEASQRLAREPRKALAALDEIEQELVSMTGKKEDHALLLAAGQLRGDWTFVTSEGLETDSILTARRAAVLEALKNRDVKAAGKALADLKGRMESVTSAREAERNKLVARWLIRNVEDPFDLARSTRMLNDDKQRKFEDLAKRLASELNLPADQAQRLMEGAVAAMVAEAENAGVKMSLSNAILPEQTRPALTREQQVAVTDYVGGHYHNINPPLWKGGTPPPPLDQTHLRIQEAFQKAKPLPTPLRVSRGMNFKDPAELNAYLQPFKQALGTDTLVPLMGYISTGTAGTPPNFVGNVEFTIIAKLGLDMTPYTGAGMDMAKEKELCLNHGTLVKVHRVKPLKGGRWQVQVEQILPAQA